MTFRCRWMSPARVGRNRAPQLVDTPPEVTVFSGQSFRLNLVGADPDGTQSFFRLAMATANVSLSHDGQLSGQLYTSRNSSRQFDVVLFDECDRETNVRIEVTVLACPCLNGGTCETWSTAEAPVYDAVYCTCLRDFTGRRCEVLVNPCYSNPCFNGRCIAQSSGIFHCACPEDTTGFGNIDDGHSTPYYASYNINIDNRCNINNYNINDHNTNDGCYFHSWEEPITDIAVSGARLQRTLAYPNPCQNGGQCQLTGPVYFRCHCDWGFTAIPVSSSQYHAGSALFEGGSDNTRGFSSNGSSAGFVQTIPSAEITASYFSSSISSTGVQPPYMSPGFLGELTPSFIAGFPPFSSSLASGFSQVERFSLFFAGPAAYGTPIVSQGFFTHGAQGFVQGLPPPTDMAPIYMTGFTAFDTASSFVPAIAAPELSASYYIGVPFQVTPENLEPTDFSVEFPGTYFAWDMLAAETIYVSDGPQAEGRVISDGFTNPTTAESSTAHVEPTPTMSTASKTLVLMARTKRTRSVFLKASADCILRDLLKGLVDSIPETAYANATSNDIREVSTPEVETPQQPKSNAGYPDGNTGLQRAKCAPLPSGDPGNGAEDSVQKLDGSSASKDTECLNGGVLTSVGSCKCSVGYTGDHCESEMCAKDCKNGGTCVSHDKCSCAEGWEGGWCEEAKCEPPCVNGGSCLEPNKCVCPPGSSGGDCSVTSQGRLHAHCPIGHSDH
ncbi:hypothetical protein HPB47_022837 [Ixodes persulcatus]|uniref:Uncharacterized protein n=1 Tax=Ixodes persulcatus TaxID=34615 RepID=A0AC60Q906_IXOPE|nr:hypothetical protein HPB47_022837 [Ixodes persulcatus]